MPKNLIDRSDPFYKTVTSCSHLDQFKKEPTVKLATFSTDGTPEIGIVIDQGVIPINQIDSSLPKDMSELVNNLDDLKSKIDSIAKNCKNPIAMSEVTLHAPIQRPGKFLAIGLNYKKHRAEAVDAGIVIPRNQMWFTKQISSITGPYGPILKPNTALMFDYEVELAIVIGKRCKQVSADDASKYIAGFTVGNDLSMRDWQLHNMPERLELMIGKSFDTHGPLGPWIVTSDEISDPHKLELRCLVNGEVRQSSNTDDMIWNCYQQIEYLSQAMTLHPGDIILTGTPPGSGFSPRTAKGAAGKSRKASVFLEVGDVVRCEIEGIGHIENKVTADE